MVRPFLFAEILRLDSACESENRRSSPSLERRVRVTLSAFSDATPG